MTETAPTAIPHDALRLPDPETWLEPALDGLAGAHDWPECSLQPSAAACIELVAAILPTLAAAILDAEAEVIEQPGVRTDLTGGQYLRWRAERYRKAGDGGPAVPVVFAGGQP